MNVNQLSCVILLLFISNNLLSHHVLGRPAYSLSSDSNTPPSKQIETRLGNFYITYMVFPAFPQAGESGRINLYLSRIDIGGVFDGKVTFKVRDDSYFFATEEILGIQVIDDGVYRQGLIFKDRGNFLISAEFVFDGENYSIDFPLQVGELISIGPIGIIILIIVLIFSVVITINVTQSKKIYRLKAKQHHTNVT